MNRDIPSLYETILKLIARYPSKCLTTAACERLLKAIAKGKFGDTDMVQVIFNQVIEAGRMTDEAMPVIVFEGRQSIVIPNSKISGKYLVTGTNLAGANLACLDISGCFQVTDAHVTTVLEQCPNITKLNVKNCRKITNTILEGICRLAQSPSSSSKSKKLKILELNIGGNFNISDAGVRNFLEKYSVVAEMTEFSLSGLKISDDTLRLLAMRCKSIKRVGLSYLDLRETTYELLFKEVGNQLEVLDWSWSSTTPLSININQPSAQFVVDSLVNSCINIKEVDLTGNKNLAVNHIVDLIEKKLAPNEAAIGRLETLKIKFIGSTKATVEANVIPYYPHLKFVA